MENSRLFLRKVLLALCSLSVLAACTVRTAGFDAWQMRDADGKSNTATIPCTVAGALLEQGVQPEKSMFDTPWTFTTSFRTQRGMYHILRFHSLGYSADIFLNGICIASADTTVGPFRIREYDVTPLLKRTNTLEVKVFKAPAQALNHGWVDWNPRPEDESMGITGPVELITTPDVEIRDVFVKPEVDPDNLHEASISIFTILVNRSDLPIQRELRFSLEDGSFGQPVSLAPQETRTILTTHAVANPRIWWSREMGSPELYHLDAVFGTQKKRVRFGLRSITSRIDEYGHRLYSLNGRDLLLKGAGWTDDRYMRDTHERISRQVEYVADMGLNCIRFENVWGKDDHVYDMCDSLGILALVGWSCQWEWPAYCGYPSVRRHGCINSPETEELAVNYFHDQVIRLRNHPAVIGWLTGSDMMPNPELEKKYLELYGELDYRPYQCSASGLVSTISGPSGAKMMGPYEYVCPDYWYLDTTHGGNYGFNTETSSGMNLPQLESLKRMLPEEDLWPVGESWNKVCTSAAEYFNSPNPALGAVRGSFGEPENLDSFVKRYHFLDYDATRSMFEAFRCGVPKTTGIVQWMLSSACPSVYWQLYDWYLVPTAAYYGTKKACAPLQLVYNYKEKAVYGVNDALPESTLTAVLRVYDTASRLVLEKRQPVKLRPRQPVKVFEGIEGPSFVDLRLVGEEGEEIASNFYCLPEGAAVYAWDKADWWGLPIDAYPSFAFLKNLPRPELSQEINRTENGWEVTLFNPSDRISFQIILKAYSRDGNLAPGVIWTDNFLSILPGETVTVRCFTDEDVSIRIEQW